METENITQIIILVILLMLSSFFSASETALMSISKIKVRHMIEAKEKGAETIGKLLDNPGRLLGTILVGNNIVNIGASALATSLAIKISGDQGVGIATGIMTILVLVFGEITPKSLAASHSDSISKKVAKPIYILSFFLNPVVLVLTKVTNTIINLLGGDISAHRPYITEEELKTMVDVGHEEGIIEGEEHQMIHNVFEFTDLQVKEVMIPRTSISAIEVTASYQEVIEIFRKEQYSRIPVYEESIDQIIGILYLKDLFFRLDKEEEFNVKQLLRKTITTFETKRVVDLFEEMRSQQVQIAVVKDEYGGTAGIITMQDIIEEIFGDIDDEYDSDEHMIDKISDDIYLFEGLARLDDVNDTLLTSYESEHYETIGGFLTGHIGRFPNKGEVIDLTDWKCTVLELHKSRIKKIRMERIREEREEETI
ncbi:MAG: HlyC/CorC family transporter [Vallitaleaceae bacterium]|nr:HlyC/CorC family transporter [Vallitaleaceae bacterium]